MSSKKYWKLSELTALTHADSPLDSCREIARQFLLIGDVPVFVFLRGAPGAWIGSDPEPASAKLGESAWFRDKDPVESAGCSYSLYGWFRLAKGALWKVACGDSRKLELLPTAHTGHDMAFWVPELDISFPLDLLLQLDDYAQLEAELEQAFRGDYQPLKERERQHLYRIIATLIGAKYEPKGKSRSKIADEIVVDADILGIELKAETIRKKLESILAEIPGTPG